MTRVDGSFRVRSLWPHQQEVVDRLGSAQQGRLIVNGPPGTGKAATATVALGRVLARTEAGRALVIANHSAIVSQFQDLVHRWIGIDSVILDGPTFLALLSQGEVSSPGCFMATYEFLSSTARFDWAIQRGWDFVLLDDVDALTDRRPGGRLAKHLWQSRSAQIVFASSTFGIPKWVDRDRAAVFDWRAIARTRDQPRIVSFRLSDEEVRFFTAVKGFLGSAVHRRSRYTGLKRRAASSLYAIESSLRQQRSRIMHGTVAKPSRHGSAVAEAQRLRELLALLDGIATDAKWLACATLIEECLQSGGVAVFTDFADTANYIYNLCSERWPSLRLTTSMAPAARWDAVSQTSGDPTVVVLTTAMADWLESIEVRSVIHYDRAGRLGEQKRLGGVSRLNSYLPQFTLVGEPSALTDLRPGAPRQEVEPE